MVDSVHMEPVDSEQFETPGQKRDAYRNAQLIKTNVQRLVRIFRREDMQQKLIREFRDVVSRPSGNEIINYNVAFENLRQLWNSKLCTSLEEHLRMIE